MARPVVLAMLLLGALMAGCIGSSSDDLEAQDANVEDTVAWAKDLPETITGLEPLAQVDLAEEMSGAGIWTEGDYAYVGGLNTGFHVVNLTDPANPVVEASIDGDQVYSRDVDLLHYEDRLVAVLATQSGGMTFVDVTDPASPEIINIVEIDPNHNVAVVPDTKLVYNSPSTGEGRANEIVDATVPEQAEVIGEFGTFGCHDISFFVNEDKQRAYCAGGDITEIWDISDPRAPEKLVEVSNPCMDDPTGPPTRSNCQGLHHSAFVNEDASILLVGDEFQGGGGPGCGLHANDGSRSASTPLGALWFYDITDEENPQLLGWFAPNVPAQAHADAVLETAASNPTGAPFSASCTSHFGEIIPGQDMVVIAWYHAGVLLIDFSDPTNPILVDQWNEGTQTWDARLHNGYVFTGDILRGLDVLELVG
ncbi:MAG: hypothetical protein R3185_02710 [Candidatus Thermoplasmatota archaeon]|nr:hypothetical protein [Candidatus Thermoplasmatota archaeon]